jgi:hypothetical protein
VGIEIRGEANDDILAPLAVEIDDFEDSDSDSDSDKGGRSCAR